MVIRATTLLNFKNSAKENNIYTLCMPPHSFYLLQPLDVGCFSPSKRAYSREIEALIRHHINHITKLEFLPALRQPLSDRSRQPIYAQPFEAQALSYFSQTLFCRS
jgi:hypothetical protein